MLFLFRTQITYGSSLLKTVIYRQMEIVRLKLNLIRLIFDALWKLGGIFLDLRNNNFKALIRFEGGVIRESSLGTTPPNITNSTTHITFIVTLSAIQLSTEDILTQYLWWARQIWQKVTHFQKNEREYYFAK